MKTFVRSVVGVVAVAFALSACGGGYDRAEYLAELEENSNIDSTMATCMVDKLEEQIGTDRLGDRGDPTDEETIIMTDIAFDCIAGG
jgi:hypothetical protein